MRTPIALLALQLGLVACGSGRTAVPTYTPRRARLHLPGIDGLSDLTTDGEGVQWAVPERDRFLVGIRAGRIVAKAALEGVPEGLDTEAIAWLSDRRFAVGTESMQAARVQDLILFVELDGQVARVVGSRGLPYAALGVQAEQNHGIEGLCSAGGLLLASVEDVQGEGDHRYALVARAPIEGGAWEVFRVALTTERGKLSALSCASSDGALDVLAIERHYAIMRIVRFVVPARGPGRALTPTVVRDLSGTLEGDPNLEGLTREGSELVLVVDNHHAVRTGPNELIRVALPEPR